MLAPCAHPTAEPSVWPCAFPRRSTIARCGLCGISSSWWRALIPGGVYISATTWLEPDVCVYPVPEFDDRPWAELPAPLLVVEVLGPSTTCADSPVGA